MSRMSNPKPARRQRRQFTDEFKAGAVRLVLDEGKTVGAVAREQISPHRRWPTGSARPRPSVPKGAAA